MNTLTWIVIALVVVAIYLSQMAGRLDSLHIRVDNSRRALQDQLLRRASEAAELAALPGATTPDSAVSFDTYAHVVRRDEEINPDIEEALTVALNFALPDAQTIAAIAGGRPGPGRPAARERGLAPSFRAWKGRLVALRARARVRVRVRACVRACVRVCVWAFLVPACRRECARRYQLGTPRLQLRHVCSSASTLQPRQPCARHTWARFRWCRPRPGADRPAGPRQPVRAAGAANPRRRCLFLLALVPDR